MLIYLLLENYQIVNATNNLLMNVHFNTEERLNNGAYCMKLIDKVDITTDEKNDVDATFIKELVEILRNRQKLYNEKIKSLHNKFVKYYKTFKTKKKLTDYITRWTLVILTYNIEFRKNINDHFNGYLSKLYDPLPCGDFLLTNHLYNLCSAYNFISIYSFVLFKQKLRDLYNKDKIDETILIADGKILFDSICARLEANFSIIIDEMHFILGMGSYSEIRYKILQERSNFFRICNMFGSDNENIYTEDTTSIITSETVLTDRNESMFATESAATDAQNVETIDFPSIVDIYQAEYALLSTHISAKNIIENLEINCNEHFLEQCQRYFDDKKKELNPAVKAQMKANVQENWANYEEQLHNAVSSINPSTEQAIKQPYSVAKSLENSEKDQKLDFTKFLDDFISNVEPIKYNEDGKQYKSDIRFNVRKYLTVFVKLKSDETMEMLVTRIADVYVWLTTAYNLYNTIIYNKSNNTKILNYYRGFQSRKKSFTCPQTIKYADDLLKKIKCFAITKQTFDMLLYRNIRRVQTAFKMDAADQTRLKKVFEDMQHVIDYINGFMEVSKNDIPEKAKNMVLNDNNNVENFDFRKCQVNLLVYSAISVLDPFSDKGENKLEAIEWTKRKSDHNDQQVTSTKQSQNCTNAKKKKKD